MKKIKQGKATNSQASFTKLSNGGPHFTLTAVDTVLQMRLLR